MRESLGSKDVNSEATELEAIARQQWVKMQQTEKILYVL
jgi:hypothetical protein